MLLLSWMQPRDHRVAARTVSALAAIGVVTTVVYLPLAEDDPRRTRPELIAISVIVMLLVAALSAAAWFFDEANRLAWSVCPFLTIAAIVVVDFATYDASLTAQVFFLFPALYGGTLLPRPGAAIVGGAAMAGEIIVVFSQLPAREAIIDAGYLSAVLVTTSVLLVRGAERQATLMALLEKQAFTDSLTGLVTRRVFDTATVAALAQPADQDGTALILLDVDHFKSVNDRFGHPAGDEVLVQLSEVLVQSSRRGDVVCRVGGDEMSVLMPNCSIQVGSRRAQEIVEAVRTHDLVLGIGEVVNISISAGLAHAPTNATTPETLYAAADAALYRAKQAGRDRVVTSSPQPQRPLGPV